MTISSTLKYYLEKQAVEYAHLPHNHTEFSLESAESAHIPGDRLAKPVILEDELGYVMAVVPATHTVQIDALNNLINRDLELASEEELAPLFVDCEPGAIPPIGSVYGIETIVDEDLFQSNEIYMEGGFHNELLHVLGEDFFELMEDAKHGKFSQHI